MALCPWSASSNSSLGVVHAVAGQRDKSLLNLRRSYGLFQNEFLKIGILKLGLARSLFQMSFAPSYTLGIGEHEADGVGLNLDLDVFPDHERQLILGLEVGVPIYSLPDNKSPINLLSRIGWRRIFTMLGKLEHSILELYGLGGISIRDGA